MDDKTHLKARQRLIVALDVDTEQAALELADRLAGRVGLCKIGLELFISCGPGIVRRILSVGHPIFLDLKLHDIPNTVAGACRVCAGLGVEMLTLHTHGGSAMLEAARKAVDDEGSSLKLLGVTVLTSLDDAALAAVGVKRCVGTQVAALGRLAQQARLDGIVCSGQEVPQLSKQTRGLFFVTPGIRPLGATVDDQSRVLTPAAAIRNGADYLVVGRSITRAPDPAAAADTIVAEIAAADDEQPVGC